MVQETLKATGMMKDLNPTVINFPTLKPIDKELIIETAKTHEVLVTVEEHSVIGGLGSAVAEVLSPLGLPCRHYLMGMQDVFGRSGTPSALLDYYGLDAKHIQAFVEKVSR